jgi:hypothetical protein
MAMINWYDRKIIYYVKENSGFYSVVKTTKSSMLNSNKIINYAGMKGKTFPFDMGKPAFRKKNRWFYFVDVDRGQLQILKKDKESLSSQLLDQIVKKELGKQLVSALESPPISGYILVVLLGAGLGIAIGYILGNFVPMG